MFACLPIKRLNQHDFQDLELAVEGSSEEEDENGEEKHSE